MRKRRFIAWGAPAILGVGTLIAFPYLVSGYMISIFTLIGIYAFAATALNLLLGNTGQVSLGQAAFYGVGAYASALLTIRLSLDFWLAMPVAGLIAALSGYVVGLTSVRLQHSYLAMATIAFNEIFIVVIDQWADLTGGVAGLGGIRRPGIGGLIFGDREYFYFVWVFLAVLLLFNRNLLHSRVGNTIDAIRQDEMASEALGIPVSRYKLKIFTLSAFYTGIAGSLFAHYARYIGPGNFRVHFSITLLIMVLLGGSRHALGGIVGSAVVVFLPELLSFLSKMAFLPAPVRSVFSEYSYHLIIYGILLFVIAAFTPGGLVKLASILLGKTMKRGQM